jgi:pimeloyl-ACP methyl ester carboxylesterase
MHTPTRTALAAIAAAALLVGLGPGGTATGRDAGRSGETDAHLPAAGGYASVNGLEMYYEIHGAGRPLVLLHGALMTIDTTFGKVLPAFATTRQVIAVEQQGHGRTADADRALTYEQMADDTAALLQQLGIEEADFFGYSMGGNVALQIAMRHPDLVGKLVVAGANYSADGYYPELREAFDVSSPDDFAGSEWHEAYARVAPNPEHWPVLVAKVLQLEREFEGWPEEDLRAIDAPALVIVGDADIVRPEHAVQMFRLLGGGVAGDLVGLPDSQLAVLPGTTHGTLVNRAEWLVSMIEAFLAAPTSVEER